MPRYECCSCDLIETLTFQPDACSSCGNAYMTDLDAVAAEEKRAAVIASQNDRFRKSFPDAAPLAGRVVLTPGVVAFGEAVVRRILEAIRAFDTFTEDNDPYGYHDFGMVEVDPGTGNLRLYWKIDLYDCDYQFGSERPDDPARTARVLTILLPSEY